MDKNREFKPGTRILIDGVEHMLVEDNQDRGIFVATDPEFDDWVTRPIAVYKYNTLDDCPIIDCPAETKTSTKVVKKKRPRKSGYRSTSGISMPK